MNKINNLKFNKNLAKTLWDNKEYFSKGKRGLIYLSTHKEKNKEKKFVIKIKNPESFAPGTIQKEYENNKFLNTANVGPKVFWFDEEKDFMIREFVDGVDFFEWLKTIKEHNKIESKKLIKKFFLNLLDQCKKMDDLFINKLEMNHPHKDLLVFDNKPVIIDFERCRKSLKPKNVTQVCQFMISSNVEKSLKNLMVFDKEKIIFLANNYKKENKNDEHFKNNKSLKDVENKKSLDYFEKLKKEIMNA